LTLSRGDPLIFLQRPISAAKLLAAALALAILVLPAVRATRSKAFTDEGGLDRCAAACEACCLPLGARAQPLRESLRGLAAFPCPGRGAAVGPAQPPL